MIWDSKMHNSEKARLLLNQQDIHMIKYLSKSEINL